MAKSKGKRARASMAARCSAQLCGPAVFTNGGDTYYETAVLRSSSGGCETRVCVGDFVSVLVQNGQKEEISIAVVESMWQDRGGSKWFEARWFEFAQDIKLSAEHVQEPGELYETDQVDECALESINSSVQVLTRTIFKQLELSRAAARSLRRGLDDSDEEGGYASPEDDEDRPESTGKRIRRVCASDSTMSKRGGASIGVGTGGDGDSSDGASPAAPHAGTTGEQRAYFCSSFLDRELSVLTSSQLLQNRSRRRAYLHSPRLRDADLQCALNVALLKGGRAADEAYKPSKSSGSKSCLEGGAGGACGSGGGDASAPLDRFARALAQLQLSAVPPSMPCRESERASVLEFTSDRLRRGGGGSLYISGMPGTGKTATVREVVRQLQASAALGKLPAFDFVELNAMRMRHPYDAYTELLRALTGRRVEHKRAAQELERMFSRGEGGSERRRPCLLLMDELDHMVTIKQTVLYNLFDWPTRPGSWLTCVSIANTMDLPERLLPRIHSRMGMTRVVFRPYKAQQVEEIVQARLTGLEVGLFDDAAVAFTAKKVAAVSGDIRRALDFCRKAVQRCRAAGQPTVTIEHVQAASRDMQEGASKIALRQACMLDKVLCIALRKRLRQQESAEVLFDDLFRTATGLWNELHLRMSATTPRLERHHALARVDCLTSWELLQAEQTQGKRSPVLRLGRELQDCDIPDALAQDPLLQPFFAMDVERGDKPLAAAN
jgi:Cdc6-like AAA superfamily ATPase